MQYLMLIYGGEKAWASMSEEEMNKVYGDYMDLQQGDGPGRGDEGGLAPADRHATTVRVRTGREDTDGPFARQGTAGRVLHPRRTEPGRGPEVGGQVSGAAYGSIEVRPLGIILGPDGKSRACSNNPGG